MCLCSSFDSSRKAILNYQVRSRDFVDPFETIYRLPRHTSTILLGVICHSPSAKAADNELLIEHVNSNVDSFLNKYPDALIVLTGDFNPNSTNISLSTLARGCGLTQLVNVPTRGNNILDWCLVNKPKLFEEPV